MASTEITTIIGTGGTGIRSIGRVLEFLTANKPEMLKLVKFAALDTSGANFATLTPYADHVTMIKLKPGSSNMDEGSGGDPTAWAETIKEQLPDIVNQIKPTTNVVLSFGGSSGTGRAIAGALAGYLGDASKVKKPHILALGAIVSTASLREITAVKNAIVAFKKLSERLGYAIPLFHEHNSDGWVSADRGMTHFLLEMIRIFGDVESLDQADKRAWLHGKHMQPGVYSLNPAGDVDRYKSLTAPMSVLTIARDSNSPAELKPTPIWQKIGFDKTGMLDVIELHDEAAQGNVLHMVVCDDIGAMFDNLVTDIKDANTASRSVKRAPLDMDGEDDERTAY